LTKGATLYQKERRWWGGFVFLRRRSRLFRKKQLKGGQKKGAIPVPPKKNCYPDGGEKGRRGGGLKEQIPKGKRLRREPKPKAFKSGKERWSSTPPTEDSPP